MKGYRRIAGLAVLTALGIFAGAGCGNKTVDTGTQAQPIAKKEFSLTGAGSTFVNPAMSKWVYAYHEAHPDVTINYQSVGSGAGISQFKEGTVDFGATDAPLSDKDEATMPSPTLNIPVVCGATVLAYNVPGLTGDLRLSPETLAGIFLGEIKSWNDPKLAADNAGSALPNLPITICHRADGSGTTYIFTDYLSAISSQWKDKVGKGKTVQWPVGNGAKGNEGVAGLIKATPGAIGYVELAYATQSKMPFAVLKNKAGQFVKATLEATSAAADGYAEELQKDIRTSIVNSPDPKAYPIAGYTYVLVATTPKDVEREQTVIDFLNWAMDSGQTMSRELQYAPLSKGVVELNKKALDTVNLKK